MRCLVTSAPLNRQQTRSRRREIRPQPSAHATPAHPYSDGLTEPGALVGSARESPAAPPCLEPRSGGDGALSPAIFCLNRVSAAASSHPRQARRPVFGGLGWRALKWTRLSCA